MIGTNGLKEINMPVIAINRHRMSTDGTGVATLVASYGCLLKCKYCINEPYLKPEVSNKCKVFTPRELYEELKIDDLYFVATNGGVTFGGGELLLYADFIEEFRGVCGDRWRIIVETSLNVPRKNVQKIVAIADEYIIDIKDMNSKIYEAYTGMGNEKVIDNLNFLLKTIGSEKLFIRVPKIKDFNSDEDIEDTVSILKGMGVENIEVFSYNTGLCI